MFLLGAAVDLENKAASVGVLLVLPGGSDAFPEKVDSIDLPGLIFNSVSRSEEEYEGNMF